MTSLTGEKVFQATDNIAIVYGLSIENAFGGSEDDTFIGNDVDKYLHGSAGSDNTAGSACNDWLVGWTGDDHFDGGGAFDIIEFIGNDSRVVVDLVAGTARGVFTGYDTFMRIEGAWDSFGNDTIILGSPRDHAVTNRSS
jgi:serralysin